MPSLFDTLGLPPKEQASETRQSESAIPRKRLSARKFARALLESDEFKAYILNGIVLNDLPPVILCRLMDYGWGKPVERIEVKNKTDRFDRLPVSEIQDQIKASAERALFLASLLNKMSDESPSEPSGDTSIH